MSEGRAQAHVLGGPAIRARARGGFLVDVDVDGAGSCAYIHTDWRSSGSPVSGFHEAQYEREQAEHLLLSLSAAD